MTRELAQTEFNKWFDTKNLAQKLHEKNADDEEAIIDAIIAGDLILNDDFSFTQKLKFPVQMNETEKLDELKYAYRISDGIMSAAIKGNDAKDMMGIAQSVISALTGQVKGTIKALDTVDSGLGKHIAAFFLI